jgi:hypothetical protein
VPVREIRSLHSLWKYGCFRAPRNASEIVSIRKRITRPDTAPKIQGLWATEMVPDVVSFGNDFGVPEIFRFGDHLNLPETAPETGYFMSSLLWAEHVSISYSFGYSGYYCF